MDRGGGPRAFCLRPIDDGTDLDLHVSGACARTAGSAGADGKGRLLLDVHEDPVSPDRDDDGARQKSRSFARWLAAPVPAAPPVRGSCPVDVADVRLVPRADQPQRPESDDGHDRGAPLGDAVARVFGGLRGPPTPASIEVDGPAGPLLMQASRRRGVSLMSLNVRPGVCIDVDGICADDGAGAASYLVPWTGDAANDRCAAILDPAFDTFAMSTR